MKAEIHKDYLNCYALPPANKDDCMKELTEKYIIGNVKKNNQYITAFQFECEKSGFKKFLNDHKLKCEDVIEVPKFVDARNAYEVICKPAAIYFMHFIYEKKEWQLVK